MTPADDATRTAAFEARIARGETIEPKDWMPGAVPEAAHPDDVASTPIPRSSACCPRATGSPARPALRRKMSLLAKVQDEAGPRPLHLLRHRDARRRPRRADRPAAQRHGQVLQHLQLSDAHLGRHGRHRLAGGRRRDREPDDAGQGVLRPVRARDGPDLQGRELPQAAGLRDHGHARRPARPAQKAMAQDALNRWWWPSLMMFGPQRQGLAQQRRAAPLEGEAEEQRRAAPAVRQPHGAAGRRRSTSRFPIPAALRRAETSDWEFGPIDWDEFYQVISGNGPCNRERLAARQQGARRRRLGARGRGGVRRQARCSARSAA